MSIFQQCDGCEETESFLHKCTEIITNQVSVMDLAETVLQASLTSTLFKGLILSSSYIVSLSSLNKSYSIEFEKMFLIFSLLRDIL